MLRDDGIHAPIVRVAGQRRHELEGVADSHQQGGLAAVRRKGLIVMAAATPQAVSLAVEGHSRHHHHVARTGHQRQRPCRGLEYAEASRAKIFPALDLREGKAPALHR